MSTLYYELAVKNIGQDTIDLKKLEISGLSKGVPYARFEDEQLVERSNIQDKQKRTGRLTLAGGESCMFYIELGLEDYRSDSLRHRLEYHSLGRQGNEITKFTEALLHFGSGPPIVLGNPLRSGPWTAVYDPSWVSGHRRVFYSDNGKSFVPGRFAIDFIKMDQQGRYAIENTDSIKNWIGYGEEVIAVADGIVSSTRDDFTESVTVSGHVSPTIDKATGNYISLKIATGVYVFYEHLKPGSIRIKKGQKIKKGDVIASLGFTGQSTGPHLHFHVADRDSPLYAEGLPYVFKSFLPLGLYTDFGGFGTEKWKKNEGANLIQNERPISNSVIDFKKF